MIFQKKKKKLILIGEIDQDNNCKDILVNLTLPVPSSVVIFPKESLDEC